jgi:rubrerythrin
MDMATRVGELLDLALGRAQTGSTVFANGTTYLTTSGLGRAFAQELTDVDILQFALTLEHLEAAMYREMLDTGILTGKEMRYFESFGSHEAAHVDALTQALQAAGATPNPALAMYNFPSFGSRMDILNFAKTAEDIGVGAYQGAAAAIQNKEYLAAAGSILQVEARHVAIVNILLGMEPAPAPTTPSLTVEEVLDKVNPILGM